ncbi:LysR family transcriptional regulator [Nocardia callitridis]|uniref:LysR family transcriptional regulator n=1 Tax=Nocardia callitridis TaxID=648753 RepID=A0ABP9KRX5_9NOCA
MSATVVTAPTAFYVGLVFDVRRLAVLEAVVRSGSLTAAATVLSYTTSAISQQITALERDVGAILVVRGPSGTRPTRAGRSLLDNAAGIFDAIATAERDLARLSSADHDVVRVASFASAAAAILPAAVAEFRSAFPRSGIQLITADPVEAVALLDGGGAEVAVITEVPGEPQEFPHLHTVPIFDDEFFVVLPAQHRLAGAAAVALAALAKEKWVVSTATGTCPDTRVFRAACTRAGFVPEVTFRSEDYSTVQGLVAAGVGVSLVPSLAAADARADVVVRRVDGPAPVRRIALATASRPVRASALAGLVGLVHGVGVRMASNPAHRGRAYSSTAHARRIGEPLTH